MPQEEFDHVMELEWVPVGLLQGTLPTWAKNIPGEIIYVVAASGTTCGTEPYHSATIPSGVLIGGMDIWRHAPEDPVELNKDWYAVVEVDGEPMYLVDGPFKDDEHWCDSLPERLENVEIFGVPKK
jgi:hypothetical protein